jgi:hypothetical protein
MLAKNKRTPDLDVQRAFFTHVEANLRAHECCERVIALRQAGNVQAAIKVEREAKKWLVKAIAIENALPARPQVGRATKAR